MLLHYPASASQRPGADECFRPGRAEAQDAVERRHDASGDVARMDYPVVKKNLFSCWLLSCYS